MIAALDPATCYRALAARDRRFDGRFFVAVSTTGIYCRPVCTARTPRAERCAFYRTAAEAERAGYRACFRCRPELAPGGAPLDAVPRLVARAVARIDAGCLSEGSLEALAAELGVSARHLRRAVQAELGVSPLELAQTRRLAIAKQLLQGTALAIPEIAFASGFGSIRRFNAAFRSRFGRAPSSLRRSRSAPAGLVIRLEHRPPLAWDGLLAFLAARAIDGVESIEGGTYARVVRDGERVGTVRVRRAEDGALLAEIDSALGPSLLSVVARLRALFDLDAEPAAIDAHLARDRALRGSIARRPGTRVPGAVDPFELVVRAIAGQRISVAAARVIVSRIATAHGTPIAVPVDGLARAFPTPARIAALDPEALHALGLTRERARTIIALARAIDARELVLEPGADPDAAIEAMQRIPGVGPWTASYVAMRALRAPDAFLPTDLVVRRALGELAPRAIEARAERWRPWRAYAVIHLWQTEGDRR